MNKDEKKEYLLKEVDLIQNIIKKVESNSFLLKGWTLMLIIITVFINEKDEMTIISIILLISLWFFDAYFIQKERMYRNLYEWVIENRLKSEEYLLDMNPKRDGIKKPNSKLAIMFSKTLGWFYLPIGIVIVIYLMAIS